MADYWISQNRKYCEFCKCWITDNKPSVDFHEKGRRHQENVKRKLRTITKHSVQSQKTTDKIDHTIRQMESAAMEAYRKDIETGGDMSSEMFKQGGSGTKKLWNEAKTRDGKSYYVNIMTKETVWHAPKEGFLSIAEQREQSLAEAAKQLKELEKFKKKEAIITMHKVRQEEAEEAARQARERMKERRVAEELAPVTYGPLLEPGKTDPYGRWQTVQERPVLELDLPPQPVYEEYPIELEPELPVREFKEKTVESLDTTDEIKEEVTSFKKRKFNGGAKRNVRQRLDDD